MTDISIWNKVILIFYVKLPDFVCIILHLTFEVFVHLIIVLDMVLCVCSVPIV